MATENRSDTFDIGGEDTVHRLGYGAMRLTGEEIIGPPDDEEEAKDVLQRATELGVDFIDTADSYGPAVSERLIGEALAPYEDVFVATKGGLWRDDRDASWPRCGQPGYIRNSILGSLDRLKVDQIDLYQYHRPDPDIDYAEAVETFADLTDEGKVNHVGVSNVSVEQLETARDVVEIATVQNQYNIGDREHEEVLDYCEEHDIGFIPWAPLGSGDLDGLDEVADNHDATEYQVGLAWLLQHSPVMLPIPGTSSIDHLEENVAASDIDLTDEEIETIES
ncbi:aldo/keto reductase [Halococcus sediminicola]|uniref:aldo/keto reductase n=1 Tax=Halococcus sediminicola TaxID=1264579 RepID=UPI000678C1A0|nr:aldo/keto reductase [Halococcus sediminicola]